VPDLLAWLRSQKVRGVIIGGVAASLLGRTRMTGDVDALVLLKEAQWPTFLRAGAAFGFVPLYHNALAFAHESRVMLLRHKPSGINVDISLGWLAFDEQVVARSIKRKVGKLVVPLPTVEDLIVMKAVAQRPTDLADIRGLLDANPDLDLGQLTKLVHSFAIDLEKPEILTLWEEIVSGRRRPGKARPRRKRPDQD
jgi:hypothetical protein